MTFENGHTPWNKGLTTETDKRLKRMSGKIRNILERKYALGELISPFTKIKGPFYGEYECPYCDEIFDNSASMGGHLTGVHSGASKRTRFKKGQLPWNKGLTKETDKRVADYSEKVTVKIIKLFEEDALYRERIRLGTIEGMKKAGILPPNFRSESSLEPYGRDFTDKLKEQIRKRDAYICQICGVHQSQLPRKLDIHHIDGNKKNNKPENLFSYCESCHIMLHWREWKNA